MFIDNPTKSKSVHDILVKNQEKLITFMQSFEIEKGNVMHCTMCSTYLNAYNAY